MPELSLPRWVRLLLFCGGLLAVALLVAQAGPRTIAAACVRAGPGLLLVLLAPAIGLFLHTLAWRLLLPRTTRPALWSSYRIYVAAQAGNQLGFGIAGESLKVAALSRAHRGAALRAMVTDNLTAFVAVVLFITLGGTLVAVPLLADQEVLLGALGASGVLALALLAVKTRADLRGAGAAVLLHVLGKAWIVAEFALATALFGCHEFGLDVLMGVSSTLASALGAAIPGQIGVVEGVVVRAAEAAGVPAATAVAIVLVRRLRSSFWTVVGGLLCLRLRQEPAPHA